MPQISSTYLNIYLFSEIKFALTFVAHWTGFGDKETGILVYTWSVGKDRCGDDIHPHVDPHHHLHDESEWTHSAVAYPVSLRGFIFNIKTLCLS